MQIEFSGNYNPMGLILWRLLRPVGPAHKAPDCETLDGVEDKHPKIPTEPNSCRQHRHLIHSCSLDLAG